MEEKYTDQYVVKRLEQFIEMETNPEHFKGISVRPEGTWNEFYPRDGIRLKGMFHNEGLSEGVCILAEKLIKQCCKGLNVTFLLDDQVFKNMSVITDVGQDLNSDKIFIEAPYLLEALRNTIIAFVLEKSMPPRKDTIPAQ